MKKVLTIYQVAGMILLLLVASCKKDENKAFVRDGVAAVVTTSSPTIVLDRNKLSVDDTSVVFTIKPADFGYSAAVTNVLQIDSMGDGWQHPQTLAMDAGAIQLPLSTFAFNSLLLKLNLLPDQSSQIQVRVQNSVTASVPTVYSDAITLTVTPFSMASSVFVPGAYQGWAVTTADSLVSPTSNGVYTGIINFTGSDLNFKVTTARNFDIAYGTGSAPGKVSTTGGNILAPANGGLLLTLNTNDNTLVITPQWSIIGDATAGAWDTDTDMFLDKTTNTWYVTATLISDGSKAIKFRFKNDWTVNLGAGGSAGILVPAGGNITIPATAPTGDVYKITMDPNKNTYTLVKQ